jgi:predicted membrane protein
MNQDLVTNFAVTDEVEAALLAVTFARLRQNWFPAGMDTQTGHSAATVTIAHQIGAGSDHDIHLGHTVVLNKIRGIAGPGAPSSF